MAMQIPYVFAKGQVGRGTWHAAGSGKKSEW